MPPIQIPVPDLTAHAEARRQAAEIREKLQSSGGRSTTMLFALPDGTGHVELGMSLRLSVAVGLFGPLMALQRNEKLGYDAVAEQAVEAAKALLRAVKADSEKEKTHV